MCVYVCVRASAHVEAKRQDDLMCHFFCIIHLFFQKWGLSLAWNLLSKLEWVSGNPSRLSVPASPALGLHVWSRSSLLSPLTFFTQVPGTELGSLQRASTLPTELYLPSSPNRILWVSVTPLSQQSNDPREAKRQLGSTQLSSHCWFQLWGSDPNMPSLFQAYLSTIQSYEIFPGDNLCTVNLKA